MLNSRSSRSAAKNAVLCAILIAFAHAPTATAQTCTIASQQKCDDGYYVKAVDDTACTACPAGLWRSAGDPLGAVTACSKCPANYYIKTQGATACTACPAGTENAAGDPIVLGAGNSVVTSCTVKENFYVKLAADVKGTACPAGMTNAAGDAIDLSASTSTPTTCDCPVNTYVKGASDTTCTACPAGTENAAGDPIFPPGAGSTVTTCTVKENFYVKLAADVKGTACPAGLVRAAGDPIDLSATVSVATACTCPVNTYVGAATDTTCTACPAGTMKPLHLGGIQSITLPSYTAGATVFPTASITTANGCTGSALGAVTAKVFSAAVSAGGTGYAVGDEITIDDGAGTGTNAVLKVASATTGASLNNIQLPTYTAGASQFPTITLTKGAGCSNAVVAGAVTAKVFSAAVQVGGTGYKVGDELTLAEDGKTGTAAVLVVATVAGGDQTAAAAVATVTVKAAAPGAYTAIPNAKFSAQVGTGGTAGNSGTASFNIKVVPSVVAVTAGAGCTAQSTAVFADGGSTLSPLTATPVNNNVIQTVTVKAGSEGAYSALLDNSAVAQKSSTGLGTGATFDYTLVPSAVAITTAGTGCRKNALAPVVTLAGNALSPTTSTTVYADAIDLSAATSTLSWCSCPVDTYVAAQADTTCTACPAGFANLAGDEIKTTTAASTPTTCGNCPLNTYVAAQADKTCTACPAGTERTVRDPIDTGAGNSVVTACTVKGNYYVANGADAGGTACPAGRTRAAGGTIGGVTACTETPCAVNEYVSSNVCTACASGFVNAAGNWPSGPDTTCTTTLCAANERVLDNKCVRCGTVAVNVAGASTTVITTTTNAAGDDPSGADTLCDGSLCALNQYVNAGVCTACAAGTTNDAHDDASGPDTSCTTAASPSPASPGSSPASPGSSPASPGSVPGASPGAPGGPGGPPVACVSGASNPDVKFTSMIVFLVLGFFALAM